MRATSLDSGRLLRDRRGIAATEFALILPILVLFSAGTIEYSRLILLTQKLQSGAFILADLTARDRTLSEAQLENIFLAIDNIIQPFDFAADGRAIVTSVGVNAAKKPVVNWQRHGSGELAATSEVGTAGRARHPARRSRHRGRRDDHRRRGLLLLHAALRHRPRAAHHPQGVLLQAPPRHARHASCPEARPQPSSAADAAEEVEEQRACSSPAMASSARSCAAAAGREMRQRLLARRRSGAAHSCAGRRGSRSRAISRSRVRSRRTGVIVDLSRPLARLSATGRDAGIVVDEREHGEPARAQPGNAGLAA